VYRNGSLRTGENVHLGSAYPAPGQGRWWGGGVGWGARGVGGWWGVVVFYLRGGNPLRQSVLIKFWDRVKKRRKSNKGWPRAG